MIVGSWSPVDIDGKRCLVYGPRLGRVYLLEPKQVADHRLQALLGLGPLTARDSLPDPAAGVVHDLSGLNASHVMPAPGRLQSAYKLLRRSRGVIPFVSMAAVLARVASWRPSTPRRTVSEIGRLVHAVEQTVRCADCYPRALLTCYLCLTSGHSCKLAIGTLAPTRKLHAWCSTGGLLPYEPSPEHYLYRPLLVIALSP